MSKREEIMIIAVVALLVGYTWGKKKGASASAPVAEPGSDNWLDSWINA